MSKAEILAELPRLSSADLAEIQAKIDDLAGNAWQDGDELSLADKQTLDDTLADYERLPNLGRSWPDVKAAIQAKLRS